MIQPKMEFLSKSLIEQVIDEAYELLMDPGVVIHNDEALHLLDNAGVEVNFDRKIAKIPQKIVEKALNTVPSSFYLYDYDKQPKVHYGGNDVHFAPASAAVKIFDLKTGKHRTAVTPDFIKWIKLVEGLSYLDSQSTSLVCNDVPKAVTDSYRVYLVLKYAKKPFITGVFDKSGFKVMKDLLVAIAGSEKDLADRPMAVFDACPSPPLQWSDATAHSLINCARYNIPSSIPSRGFKPFLTNSVATFSAISGSRLITEEYNLFNRSAFCSFILLSPFIYKFFTHFSAKKAGS